MKLYGSLERLVSILFRKNGQDITLRPNQSTTYTAARDAQLPAGDADHVLVSRTSTDTLTNKTIDGDDNTVQDLALGSLKTLLADADKVIRRDASGAVISGNALPNSSAIVTTDATQTLTGKTIDADSNTITNIENADIKAGAAIDAAKIHDGSVSNTEFGYLNGVTSAIQTQLNGKQADVITTEGDLVVGDASGDPVRLPIGTNGYVLTSNGTTASWQAPGTSFDSFAADWVTGDGATKVVTHNLGTKDVQVELYDKTDDSTIWIDSIVRTNTNSITLTASEAPGAAGWRVTIHAV